MHIFDELTEKIAIMQQEIEESSEFTPAQKYDLKEMLGEVDSKINEIAE